MQTDETITIAGQSIPIRMWGVAKQLAAAFNPELSQDNPMKLTHQIALAYNAGYLEAKREGMSKIDLKEAIQSLDNIADDLRRLQRQ